MLQSYERWKGLAKYFEAYKLTRIDRGRNFLSIRLLLFYNVVKK